MSNEALTDEEVASIWLDLGGKCTHQQIRHAFAIAIEVRALASLPEGAETPVAWRWEETKLGPGDWRYSEEGPNPHRTCQALYTRPEPAGAKTPRYSEELRLLKAGYAAGKEWASRWIGVDESLPEDEQSVVVWKAGRFNSFDKTCRHRGEWLMPSNEQRDAITHWMLPNPPGAAIDEATKP